MALLVTTTARIVEELKRESNEGSDIAYVISDVMRRLDPERQKAMMIGILMPFVGPHRTNELFGMTLDEVRQIFRAMQGK